MQDDFELETVLSIITGINFTNDINSIYDLYSFIFEDPMLEYVDFNKLNELAKNHIFRIHPELKRVSINSTDLDKWLKLQKNIYGDTITISIIGEPVIKYGKKSYHSYR